MTGPVEKSALGQIGGTNGDELFEQPLSVIESGKETDDASFSTNEDEDHASLASSQVFLHPDRRGASSEHGMSLSEMTGTCEEQDIDIVPRESKTLTIIRVVNFLSLIAGTVAISLFLKVSTEEAEISGFESAFQDQASLLSNTWINRLDLQEGHVSSWEEFLKESQAPSQIIVVVKDQCREETRSFQLFGTDAENLGLGEKHDRNMSSLKHSYKLASYLMETEPTIMCEINLDLYPTPEMQSDYLSNRPTVNMTVPLIFGSVLLVVFMIYDCMVRKRHRRMTHDVVRSQKILSSLFPANVQERLFNLNMMESAAINFDLDVLHSPQPPRLSAGLNVPAITEKKNMEATVGDHSSRPSRFGSSKSPNTVPNRDCSNKIQVRVDDNSSHIQNISVFLSPPLVSQDSQRSIRSNLNKSEPIADLFPEATVMFADISGFTAWSSEREPTQVFRLLETIYRAFDKIAKKRKVFKVETIGDCYMAVTGLPDPMKDHAVVMTKFAKECMHNMNDLTRRLEMILGPGTAELRMRFGLNSGPVTAGVLRGEKSRFQLFGDTVNFASRMESTGLRNRIQVSQATADLLLESCLRHWIHPRNDLVHAKGKGEVQTYWVSMRSASGRPLPFRLSDRMLKLEAKSDSMPKLKSRRKVSLLRELSLRREKSIRQEPSFRAPGKISSIDSRERRNLLEESQHSNNRWYESKKIFVDHEMYDSSDLEFDDLTRQER
jgi:class 3 adenylate cyclase